jgi:hypothetical protein
MGWGCHTATDNSNSAGHNSANHIPGKRGALQYANQISQDLELPNSDGYKKKSLNSWKLAPVVPKNKGLPGEMGKAVVIPKDREEEKKGKVQNQSI